MTTDESGPGVPTGTLAGDIFAVRVMIRIIGHVLHNYSPAILKRDNGGGKGTQ